MTARCSHQLCVWEAGTRIKQSARLGPLPGPNHMDAVWSEEEESTGILIETPQEERPCVTAP